MYEIQNKIGRVLCWQRASNERQALDCARMYGVRGAVRAVLVAQ